MRSHYSSEVGSGVEGEVVSLAGWVHEVRDLGKLKFLILRDRFGRIQVTAKEETTPKAVLAAIDSLTRESIIQVTGTVTENDRAPSGFEIIPAEIKLVAASQTPLPLDPTEKVDAELETRLENRFIDVRKPKVAAIFTIRAKIQEAFREYFTEKNFVEANAPSIIAAASEGGTELFAISYFEREAFLCQSPQLYKQMLMASGLDRVFITMPVFRAELHNTPRHLNEAYQMDIEKAFIDDEEGVLTELEGVVHHILKRVVDECGPELEILERKLTVPKLPFKRFTYDEILKKLTKAGVKLKWGEDLNPEAEKKLHELVGKPFFIKKWPTAIRAFYSRPLDDNPKYCSAFDLMYEGIELSSGAQRIHDHSQLVERLTAKGLDTKNFEFYLKAFRYGMPPHGGWSIGSERITMALTGVSNIRECVLWPRDRTRLDP